MIHLIAYLAAHASLCDSSSYGLGLCKFHVFCDIFSILESDCLPASFELLYSFALWVAMDPSMLTPGVTASVRFEPVLVSVVQKYLTAIQAWHLAQDWPAPLLDNSHDHINWSLQELENLEGACKCPICPLVTIEMLCAIHVTLDLHSPLADKFISLILCIVFQCHLDPCWEQSTTLAKF